MNGSYSYGLVFLSIVVAILASYTALDLARRIEASRSPRTRGYWLAGGAISMGVGIWSMHFIGMLAFSLPIPLGYDATVTGLSLAIAIAISAFALFIVSRESLSKLRLVLGGILMGIGIAAMHYTGMAAMFMQPGITYIPWLFAASIAIAMVAAMAALWIVFTLRRDGHSHVILRRLAAAVVMGFAIAGMHYTGMAAAQFAPGSICGAWSGQDHGWLWLAVTLLTLAILAVTLVLSVLDSRFESETGKLAASLQTANERLLHLATHDSLTNLPNRLLLTDRLQHAIHVASRSKRLLAVMYMDLDGFKTINDSLGHPTGDALLKAVAGRLSACMRKEDMIARLGGDEFVVLVEELGSAEEAAVICEKILDCMSGDFAIRDTTLRVTTSIGVAVYPTDGETVDAMLKNADAAMYEAKQGGRNGYRYFEAGMNVSAMRTLRIQEDLRRALRNGQLSLHYQPKFRGSDQCLIGAEALLRWEHPELGFIGPSEFIPVAERSGLILEIGEWVLRRACAQMREWLDAGLEPVRIAVNLSPQQLRQEALLDMLLSITSAYRVSPKFLMLEITETVAMGNAEVNVETIQRLQAHGFDVAIDDFGTGYSSLSYLQQFRVRQLKVDRFFVDGLDRSADEGQAIVSAIIALAHSLQMEVVAEGVETQSQLDKLKRLACDQIQGYLLGRPVPPDEFLAVLQAKTKAPCARQAG